VTGDRHMNPLRAGGGMRGQADFKDLGVIVLMIALAVILFLIVRSIMSRGFG
jgi:hypothetical protein